MEIVELVLPIPPSDNNRLIPVVLGGFPRMVPSAALKEYKKLALPLLIHQWNKHTIIVPSVNHQLHIQVKAYVPNWRGDSSNYTKVLKDVFTGIVYDDDKWVHVDYLDTVKDPENPRLHVVVPIDSFSVVEPAHPLEEDLDDESCTCSRQKLLGLGWHYWETTHHPSCKKYRPLIVKHGRKLTLARKGVAAPKTARRRRTPAV